MRDAVDVFRGGSSPFDAIVQHNEVDDTEYWVAREMMPFLGYAKWSNFEKVIKRAKSACLNAGHRPSDHFAEVGKMIDIGKGGQRSFPDVHMDRFGCYFVAMNGDPDKPEIAAAQRYFVVKTRAAEIEAIAAGVAAAPASQSSIDRPWGVRFRETLLPHIRFVNMNYVDCFTVVTALMTPMLFLEDEIIRHMMTPQASDRPDVSIGLRWARDRKSRGLPNIQRFAELEIPGVSFKPNVSVFENSERGTFEAWFYQEYLPNHLPDYLMNKPEFKVFGKLPLASTADNTCRSLTGSPAKLEPRVRRQLVSVGGFCPVGKKVPALGGEQRSLFD